MAPKARPPQKKRPIYFKEWREAAGLKQRHVAEYLGMDQTTISRFESGTSYDQYKLEKAAELFKCEPADLLHGPPWKHRLNDVLSADAIANIAQALCATFPEANIPEDEIAAIIRVVLSGRARGQARSQQANPEKRTSEARPAARPDQKKPTLPKT